MGCRGIDTTHVGHVVLFDFPRDPSEYIRRVGRTARGASGTGQSSILVLGRQVSFKRGPELQLFSARCWIFFLGSLVHVPQHMSCLVPISMGLSSCNDSSHWPTCEAVKY